MNIIEYNITLRFKNSTKKDYSTPKDAQGDTFYFNFCYPSVTAKCTSQYCGKNCASVCQDAPTKNGTDQYSSGLYNEYTFDNYKPNPSNGFIMVYTGGDFCKVYDSNRTTTIIVTCDKSSGVLTTHNATENDCDYTIYASSEYACDPSGKGGDDDDGKGGNDDGPKPKGGSSLDGGAIFLIILFSLIGAYIIGGIIVMVVVKKARGTDIIPNKEFWFDFPMLLKDGVMFLVGLVTGKGTSSGYETL